MVRFSDHSGYLLYNEKHVIAVVQEKLTDKDKISVCNTIKKNLPVIAKKYKRRIIYEKKIKDTNSLTYTSWNCKYHGDASFTFFPS